MATLAGIRTLVLSKLGDGTINRPTSAQVTAQINSSIDFYEGHPFWFNQDIATLTATVSTQVLSTGIPDDFKYIIEDNGVGGLVLLDDVTKVPLIHKDPLEFDICNMESEGRPSIYTYRKGQFELYNIPDYAYPIYLFYQKQYEDLVDDEDENSFTQYASRLIEYKTLADCLRDYRSDYERAAVYDGGATADYQGGLLKIEMNALRNETKGRITTGVLQTENIIEEDYY